MLVKIKMVEVLESNLLGTKYGEVLENYSIEAKNWIEATKIADKKFIKDHPNEKRNIFSYVL